MTKEHLESLRSLTQFERCWSVIDSHLELYRKYEALCGKVEPCYARFEKWDDSCDKSDSDSDVCCARYKKWDAHFRPEGLPDGEVWVFSPDGSSWGLGD